MRAYLLDVASNARCLLAYSTHQMPRDTLERVQPLLGKAVSLRVQDPCDVTLRLMTLRNVRNV